MAHQFHDIVWEKTLRVFEALPNTLARSKEIKLEYLQQCSWNVAFVWVTATILLYFRKYSVRVFVKINILKMLWLFILTVALIISIHTFNKNSYIYFF